jgi:hypothetical protein
MFSGGESALLWLSIYKLINKKALVALCHNCRHSLEKPYFVFSLFGLTLSLAMTGLFNCEGRAFYMP